MLRYEHDRISQSLTGKHITVNIIGQMRPFLLHSVLQNAKGARIKRYLQETMQLYAMEFGTDSLHSNLG